VPFDGDGFRATAAEPVAYPVLEIARLPLRLEAVSGSVLQQRERKVA